MRSLSIVVMSLLLGICLVWASAARAGEWAQVTCTQTDGKPAPVEGWESVNQGGPDSGLSDTCEQSGGALTAFDSSIGGEEMPYAGPMWVYTAPEGSKIAGGALTVSLLTPQGQAYVATPQNSFTSAADVLVNCQYNIAPCATSGITGTWTIPSIQAGGTQLFMAAFCVAPHEKEPKCPADSGGGVNAEISLYAADVELQNSSTPTGTDFAGSLLGPNASGTADLTFNAQDLEGPGVYRVIVDVDGTAVYQGTPEANGGRCASIGVDSNGVSEFLYPQPCKRSVAVDVPVNTTKLSNGSHQLKVIVQDAAGNFSTVYAGTISVANPGSPMGTPIGPGSPAAERGPANGTNASDQAKLSARWQSTAKPTRTSTYGQVDRVTGRLTTSTGQPISGAMIDVTETPADQGARAASLASVRTGPTGAWTLAPPKDISSGTLRFAYRSHVNDTVPVTAAVLTLRVHAGIALRIAPHVTSVGHTIHFSGVLHGAPIPPGGKQLVLEASSGGEWIQFDTITTDSKGRYHASYRFKFPGPAGYRFRVYVPHEADFPFLGGTSNVVGVYER